MSPLTSLLLRATLGGVRGLSDKEAPKFGAIVWGGVDGLFGEELRGGEGMVCISCLELCPRRRGLREDLDFFSGDDDRSIAFEFLPGRLRTVPSLLNPPKLLFCGFVPS